MQFHPLPLEGAYYIELDLIEDERGHFTRTFCREEFLSRGLNSHLEQCSFSYNKSKKTLRGMHYQEAPHRETKLICCIQGAIYDVIIDLRPNSQTFLRWHAIELTANQGNLLYVPEGFAHGFQTLQDHTKVSYQISQKFHPSSSRGIRWNDPLFSIEWPYEQDIILSEKDKHHPLLSL